MSADPTGLSVKDALDHGWNWFAVHAAQRLQSFNFFLVATAFLVAGYATVLDKHPNIAAAVSLFGAWMTFWFHRMERRTRQLVRAGEEALKPFQERLAALADQRSLSILQTVERAESGASTYGAVIRAIQWSTLLLFLGMALYAMFHALESITGI